MSHVDLSSMQSVIDLTFLINAGGNLQPYYQADLNGIEKIGLDICSQFSFLRKFVRCLSVPILASKRDLFSPHNGDQIPLAVGAAGQ